MGISYGQRQGGQPYWSWYGFNGRVEWCACFASWSAHGHTAAEVIYERADAERPFMGLKNFSGNLLQLVCPNSSFTSTQKVV